jgi:hypothetical protein
MIISFQERKIFSFLFLVQPVDFVVMCTELNVSAGNASSMCMSVFFVRKQE